MQKSNFLAGLGLCVLLFSLTLAAQTSAPDAFQLQPYLTGLNSPVLLTNAKDGTKRNFVVQVGGIIKVVQPGSTAPTNFLDISGKISIGGERGLLGLAFHPQFAANGYFFVNYTRAGDGATVVARYKTSDNTNTLGDPNSERILLTIAQPFSNHNGGMIEFGPDGNLYIGMGDGGSGNDPFNNAQNINVLLGKFLRITPDISGNNNNPAYTIPADNPFVGRDGADEIYAVGVRNPFRWSFDRGGMRQLYAGDVGQGVIEEVDIITKGANYGWRVYEGNQCTGIDPGLCNPNNFTPPILQYDHSGGKCSISGGYVYRGTRGTLPNGAYIYGDYCSGEIFMWLNNQQSLLLATTRNIPSFGEDEDGELYVVGIGSGTVEKLVSDTPFSNRSKNRADFDGDGKTDYSVFRPSNGVWYILNSQDNSFRGRQFGQDGDIPTPEDFDGDFKADIGVFRPSNGFWYYLRSSDNTFYSIQFGQSSDQPIAADYDGDGKADIAVSRSGQELSSPRFVYVLQSANGTLRSQQFGTTGTDRPVRGDFDGDGKADIAVYSEAGGNWYVLRSFDNSFYAFQFGNGNFQDIPVPGDYDGDGRTDFAVFRKANGTWYLNRTQFGFTGVQFGFGTDIPVPGNYDGDGKTDIAVWRPSNGTWYVNRSSDGGFQAAQFGQDGDLPVPFYAAP